MKHWSHQSKELKTVVHSPVQDILLRNLCSEKYKHYLVSDLKLISSEKGWCRDLPQMNYFMKYQILWEAFNAFYTSSLTLPKPSYRST